MLCDDVAEIDDGGAFASRLWGTEFKSLGRNLSLGTEGDIAMDYSVMDMNIDSKKFEVAC